MINKNKKLITANTKSTESDLTTLIVEGIQERKGKKISIIDLSGIEVASVQKYIICQGSSTMQVSGVADSIREYVQQQCGRKPYNYDGYKNCQWIVIDYGEIMVHVFLPEFREYYSLEQLWSDAVIKEIEDLD